MAEEHEARQRLLDLEWVAVSWARTVARQRRYVEEGDGRGAPARLRRAERAYWATVADYVAQRQRMINLGWRLPRGRQEAAREARDIMGTNPPPFWPGWQVNGAFVGTQAHWIQRAIARRREQERRGNSWGL